MLKKLTITLVAIIILIQGLAIASAQQTNSKDAWKTYTDANLVKQIALDGKGNAWLATSGGAAHVSKDGKWQIYTTMNGLIDNNVLSVAIDPKGNVWFATPEGASVLQSNGKWQTYTEKNGLLSNNIWSIKLGPEGSVYLASDKGIDVVKDGKWHSYTEINGLPSESGRYGYKFDINPSGKLIIAYKNQILQLNAKGNFESQNFDFEDLPVLNMLSDRKGNIWVVNAYGSVMIKPDKAIVKFRKELVSAHNFMDITEDSQGNIWLLTSQKIYVYEAGKWKILDYPQIIKDQVAINIKVDKQGDIWLSAFQKDTGNGTGLTLFAGGKWNNYRQKGPLGSSYSAVTLDGLGNIWFGANSFRLSVLTPNGDWLYRKVKSERINALTTDSFGNVWVATSGNWIPWNEDMGTGFPMPSLHGDSSTAFFQNGSIKSYSEQLGGNSSVSAIGIGPIGKVWFAINASSESIDPVNITLRRADNTWIKFPYERSADHPVIQSIAAEPKGNVWLGTSNGLKLRKPDGKLQDVKIPGLKVPLEIISMALENEKTLWLTIREADPSTRKGLGVIRRYPDGSWNRYNAKNGLLNDYVNTIFIDKQGNKWFGTNVGVSVLKSNGKWSSYTTKDGLADNKVYGITQDNNGDYWFATDGGISQLKPAIGKI